MYGVYAKEHHLIFNSKKSVMITFKKKRYKQSHDPDVFLNDARMPNKDEIVHLYGRCDECALCNREFIGGEEKKVLCCCEWCCYTAWGHML